VKIGAAGKRERLAVMELDTQKVTVVGNFTMPTLATLGE
jgi:hypothetical protein